MFRNQPRGRYPRIEYRECNSRLHRIRPLGDPLVTIGTAVTPLLPVLTATPAPVRLNQVSTVKFCHSQPGSGSKGYIIIRTIKLQGVIPGAEAVPLTVTF